MPIRILYGSAKVKQNLTQEMDNPVHHKLTSGGTMHNFSLAFYIITSWRSLKHFLDHGLLFLATLYMNVVTWIWVLNSHWLLSTILLPIWKSYFLMSKIVFKFLNSYLFFLNSKFKTQIKNFISISNLFGFGESRWSFNRPILVIFILCVLHYIRDSILSRNDVSK